MKPKAARPGSVIQLSHTLAALACLALLSSGHATLRAQAPPAAEPAVQESAAPPAEEAKIPNDQLDSLVAPFPGGLGIMPKRGCSAFSIQRWSREPARITIDA